MGAQFHGIHLVCVSRTDCGNRAGMVSTIGPSQPAAASSGEHVGGRAYGGRGSTEFAVHTQGHSLSHSCCGESRRALSRECHRRLECSGLFADSETYLCGWICCSRSSQFAKTQAFRGRVLKARQSNGAYSPLASCSLKGGDVLVPPIDPCNAVVLLHPMQVVLAYGRRPRCELIRRHGAYISRRSATTLCRSWRSIRNAALRDIFTAALTNASLCWILHGDRNFRHGCRRQYPYFAADFVATVAAREKMLFQAQLPPFDLLHLGLFQLVPTLWTPTGLPFD